MDMPALECVAGSKLKDVTVGVYDNQKSAKLVEKKIMGTYFATNQCAYLC